MVVVALAVVVVVAGGGGGVVVHTITFKFPLSIVNDTTFCQ